MNKRPAIIGLLCMSPAVLFVIANLLNEVGIPFLYQPIDALFLSSPSRFRIFNVVSPVLFLGGIAVALLINVVAISKANVAWQEGRLVGSFTIHPTVLNLGVIATGAFTLAVIGVYVVGENLGHLIEY